MIRSEMIQICQLVDFGRFRDGKQALFLLYLPIGCLLTCIRLIALLILLISCWILPQSETTEYFILKLFQTAFGIVIESENRPDYEYVKAFVGNSVSHFDSFVIRQLTGCVSPSPTIMQNASHRIKTRFGCCTDCTLENMDTLERHLTKENPKSLFLQPESTITNGKSILEFDDQFYEILKDRQFRIQSVVIQVQRQWFDIAVVTLHSSFLYNVPWYILSPWTKYTVRFLEPCLIRDRIDFVNLRHDMQKALHLDDCEINKKVYDEFVSSRLGDKNKMVSFLNEICCTDIQSEKLKSFIVKRSDKSSSNTLTTFLRDPNQRMKTLEERKKQMFEEARRKYIQKMYHK